MCQSHNPRHSIQFLSLIALALVFATKAAAVNEKVIHNFIIYPHGAYPVGNLIADAAGNLYGTTQSGGEHGNGAVFRLTRKSNGKWVETVLHSFGGNFEGVGDGRQPTGGLTFDTSGNLYGTTVFGGRIDCRCGTIFEFTPAAGGKWNYHIIYRFKGTNDGTHPNSGLVFDTAGNLYGTTAGANSGAVFELIHSSKGWTGKSIYDFGTGQFPTNLAIDAGGNLYGLATGIFQLVRRKDGTWTENSLCNGCAATGVPVFDKAGNLYVGAQNQVLELVRGRNWTVIVIATFSATDGSGAAGALTFDESGNLYGTNASGGQGSCFQFEGCGTVFKLTHGKNGEWQHEVLYKFKGTRDGEGPSAGVIFGQGGNLYGTTRAGGYPLACAVYLPTEGGCGTVFELAISSAGEWKHAIIDQLGIGDGNGPLSGLVADSAGDLYGTAPQGPSGCGMVYELIPSAGNGWKERILYQFRCKTHDGIFPASGLTFDSAGNLYGTTQYRGAHGGGTVFELLRGSGDAWTENVLYNFTGNADGYGPVGALVFYTAGNLYGTTEYGGRGQCLFENFNDYGCGVVYKLSLAMGGIWTETTLHTFLPGTNDGIFPAAALVFDQAGNLYGTTTEGGNGPCQDRAGNLGCGIVFELSPRSHGAWAENVLYNFTGLGGNSGVSNGLTMDSQGNLYGATFGGGIYCVGGCGTVYELSPSSGERWNATVLYNFGGFKGDGNYPAGNVTFDNAGNLYGTTYQGGTSSLCYYGCGTVFQLSPSGGGWTESVFHSFGGPYADGASPLTGVILAPAGNLYGTTYAGGVDEGVFPGGTVFEIIP